jgi:hypothetical protein
MAYEDWSREFQDVFEDIPGVPYFRDFEREHAEDLFEAGFMHYGDRDSRKEARIEFFDVTGLPADFFPWEEWREAYGID